MTLFCGCGEPVIIVDDYGSIECSADCGWEGIHLQLVALVITEEDIEWVS